MKSRESSKRRRNLEPYEKLFAVYYWEQGCKNATAALERAGYKTSSRRSLNQMARLMLLRPGVQEELERLRNAMNKRAQEIERAAIATKEEIAERLTRLLRANFSDFLEIKDGQVVGFKTPSDDALSAIKRLRLDRLTPERIADMELESKLAAAAQLIRLMGYDAPPKLPVAADGAQAPIGYVIFPAPTLAPVEQNAQDVSSGHHDGGDIDNY